MNAVAILSRLAAGVALGVLFYMGLWLTVRALLITRHPALLTVSSFWIRTLTLLASFLFLTQGRWQYALTCVVGFVVGRVAVTKSLRVPAARTKCP